MGGRGGSSGIKSQGKIIKFPGSGDGGNNPAPQSNKWDYQGITGRVDDLEKAMKTMRSGNKAAAIYRALQSQDKLITSEMERNKNGTADLIGDDRVLMKERRRVRTLLKKLKSMEML